MSSSSVWVHLYYKGEKTNDRDAVETKISNESNIGALKAALQANEMKKELSHAGLTEIFVYKPHSQPTFAEGNRIRPNTALARLIKELKKQDPPVSIDYDHPLIVVAPAQQQSPDDVDQPANILGKGVLDKLYAAVFYLKDAEGNPIGTGYCVNESTAVSAAHNFPDNEEGTKVTGYFGRPHADQSCDFMLDFIDRANDFAVLVLEADKARCDTFLNPSHISLAPGISCVLVAFQIGLHNDLKHLDDDKLSVGVFPASIAKAHDRHFVYLAPSFAGDSGGAIILKNGTAIGIHIETVNQARERLRVDSLQDDAQTEDIISHLKDVEASVDSLTSALSSGALGISVSSVMAAYYAAKAKQAMSKDVKY